VIGGDWRRIWPPADRSIPVSKLACTREGGTVTGQYKSLIAVPIIALATVQHGFAREAAPTSGSLTVYVNNEEVKVQVTGVLEAGDGLPAIAGRGSDSMALKLPGERLEISCKLMCGGGYSELIYGCPTGVFQWSPGIGDIITTWVQHCIQPFRVIIYNISASGVRKVLDVVSGMPPQFIAGKTVHVDVVTFRGTTGDNTLGRGHDERWEWNGETYSLAKE